MVKPPHPTLAPRASGLTLSNPPPSWPWERSRAVHAAGGSNPRATPAGPGGGCGVKPQGDRSFGPPPPLPRDLRGV